MPDGLNREARWLQVQQQRAALWRGRGQGRKPTPVPPVRLPSAPEASDPDLQRLLAEWECLCAPEERPSASLPLVSMNR